MREPSLGHCRCLRKVSSVRAQVADRTLPPCLAKTLPRPIAEIEAILLRDLGPVRHRPDDRGALIAVDDLVTDARARPSIASADDLMLRHTKHKHSLHT